uniref:Ribosomal protein S1 n=1 Tax=Closterium baillyanum TaxID=1416941 RepID=U5YE39_9VIRI|nr:ribosomal protein S1 [Closterium baillyanum]AGZ90253.1 ribosomal protein S1 [Closterium baillyanum]
MNFAQLFQKSNSSLNQLQGNVLQCSVSQVRGDLVVVETGLARSSVCKQSELNTLSKITKANTFQRSCVIGIEDVESANGEPNLVFPKSLQKICKRKLVWTELTKVWRSAQNNRIRGFILNSVNGGYAVAIAGHIAFLPRSLRLERKAHIAQWRKFSILSMNPKIGNIVVKETSRTALRATVDTIKLRYAPFHIRPLN